MPITNGRHRDNMPRCILQQEASQGLKKLRDLQQENASNCSLFNKVESILGRSPAPKKSLYRPPEPHILHNHKSTKLVTGQVVGKT